MTADPLEKMAEAFHDDYFVSEPTARDNLIENLVPYFEQAWNAAIEAAEHACLTVGCFDNIKAIRALKREGK